MTKLIDSGELLEQIDKYMAMTLYGCSFRGGKIPPMMLEMRQAVLCDVKQLIYSTPTIDAAPVRRGEWKYFHKQNRAVCTQCSFERDLDTDFGAAVSCPNCGADMREEERDGH